MEKDKDLWRLSAVGGNGQIRRGAPDTKPAYLFGVMDEMAQGGQPLVIETDSEKVLTVAAEYAARKGYDLSAPLHEQNLAIIAAQQKLAGEEIPDGSLGPGLAKRIAPETALAEEDGPGKPTEPGKTQEDPDKAVAQAKPEPGKAARQLFPVKNPPEVIARTKRGYPAVRDHGDRIAVTRVAMLAVTPPQKRDRDALLHAALLQARERFGEPVRVSGNSVFEREIARLAVAQGIPLEMTSVNGERHYQKLLERQAEKPGLGMSGQLQPAEKTQKRGFGRGLDL